MTTADTAECHVLSGYCPDRECGAKLFFPASSQAGVECSGCGQHHLPAALTNVEVVTDPQVALHNILKNVLLNGRRPKRGTDSVQVNGVSNYQCKLLSPLLTSHGMERQTGLARPLRDLGQPATFNCGTLASRSFSIDITHVDVPGYGRDITGGATYLRQTLSAIHGGNVEGGLVPIHADGDGHCLVHALSRALVGRELFWHALRENLAEHLSRNLGTYRHLLRDFIGQEEWADIIAECSPDYAPANGGMLGMQNVHIFGLANVLHRPIILLDSISGIQSLADYTGVFLPSLTPVEECRGSDGALNRPLCIAWSSSARNHYIALVSIRKRPLPRIPAWMIPKVWGVPQELLGRYIRLEPDGSLLVGGYKYLQDGYILRIVKSMEALFLEQHGVCTALVNDVYQCIYKSTGMAGLVKPEAVVEQTRNAVLESRLFRCLLCDAVTERTLVPASLRPGGILYTLAVNTHGRLSTGKTYSFPTHGIMCSYNEQKDQLVVKQSTNQPRQCCWCQGSQMRIVRGDGTVVYENGDRTATRTTTSRCQCGFKHFYNGQEYDNLPQMIPVSLDWGGRVVTEEVPWFQYESDTTLNSNVFQVAQTVVQRHFPGEFGSERLVQKVVDTILRFTASSTTTSDDVVEMQDVRPQDVEEEEEEVSRPSSSSSGHHEETDASWRRDTASKIILTGPLSKGLHKEQLGRNETERAVLAKIQQRAPQMQAKVQPPLQQQGATVIARRRSGTDLEDAESKGATPKLVIKQAKTTDVDDAKSSKRLSTEVTEGATAEGSTAVAKSVAEKVVAKKIRVSTSDGRQLSLTLEPDMTYHRLQQRLTAELGIAADHQRIKHGFPPRQLLPSDGADKDRPLSIQNGDRITVEIVATPTATRTVEDIVPIKEPSNAWPAHQASRNSWSGFESNSRDHSSHELLNGLTRLQNASADSLDMSIGSLELMATLTGRDLWTHVQGMPHLFSVGGLFYQQAQRDLDLTDGKHCTLPSLPKKVFRYNAAEYRLELCLEPHGHYPVSPGLEERVLNSKILPTSTTSSAVATSSATAHVVAHRDIRMPRDIDPRGIHTSRHVHPCSISEDDGGEDEAGMRRRLGPGYSVMASSRPEEVEDMMSSRVSAELRQLASEIESIVARTELGDITEEQTEHAENPPSTAIATISPEDRLQPPPPPEVATAAPSTNNPPESTTETNANDSHMKSDSANEQTTDESTPMETT